jgi:D-alanyl-D-alanine carboxypeptidase
MKKMILLSFLLYLVAMNFMTCSKDSPVESKNDPTLAERLQKALDDGLESYNGIGISAAVIMPDGETWVGVSGVSHGTTAITPDMPFAAGSIAKIFTGSTILQLVQESKISLEDSLYKWLPAYPYIDSTITVRQLLNHTGGIYDFVDNPDYWIAIFAEPSKVWTPEEMILAFNRESVFPKGTDWNYSTTGYALLRMIITKIAGQEISIVNRDRFFIPLALDNTFTSMGEALPANTAHGWWDLDGDGTYDDFFSWPRTAFTSGIAGEVFTTAEDLAKWARALFHDRSVLTQQSLDQMLTFHSPCTGEESMGAGYGLGVVKFNPQLFNGLEALGHSGNAPGYAAASIYLPDYDVCIGFTDNTEEGDAMLTIADLMDIITTHLDEEP